MSDKPQHSPGPWKWDGGFVRDARGFKVIDSGYDRDRDTKVFFARGATDAQLIASAPEMLQLLRELEWNDGGWCQICYRKDDVHSPDCRLGLLLERLGRE